MKHLVHENWIALIQGYNAFAGKFYHNLDIGKSILRALRSSEKVSRANFLEIEMPAEYDVFRKDRSPGKALTIEFGASQKQD